MALEENKSVPSVSVQYAANGNSTKSNEKMRSNTLTTRTKASGKLSLKVNMMAETWK